MLSGGGVVFKTNGAMAVCPHIADFEIADADQVHEMLTSPDKFTFFWNSDGMRMTRQKANWYKSDACKVCNNWANCGGGCLIHWASPRMQKLKLRPMPSVFL